NLNVIFVGLLWLRHWLVQCLCSRGYQRSQVLPAETRAFYLYMEFRPAGALEEINHHSMGPGTQLHSAAGRLKCMDSVVVRHLPVVDVNPAAVIGSKREGVLPRFLNLEEALEQKGIVVRSLGQIYIESRANSRVFRLKPAHLWNAVPRAFVIRILGGT